MLLADASEVPAGNEEQSGSALDDDPPHVPAPFDDPSTSIFNLELEVDELGRLLAKPWRLILAPPSIGESDSLRPISARIHHPPIITTRSFLRRSLLDRGPARSPR